MLSTSNMYDIDSTNKLHRMKKNLKQIIMAQKKTQIEN